MTDTQVEAKNEVEVFKEYSKKMSPAAEMLLDNLLNTVAAIVAMNNERKR